MMGDCQLEVKETSDSVDGVSSKGVGFIINVVDLEPIHHAGIFND